MAHSATALSRSLKNMTACLLALRKTTTTRSHSCAVSAALCQERWNAPRSRRLLLGVGLGATAAPALQPRQRSVLPRHSGSRCVRVPLIEHSGRQLNVRSLLRLVRVSRSRYRRGTRLSLLERLHPQLSPEESREIVALALVRAAGTAVTHVTLRYPAPPRGSESQ